jgi:hypothetical protein
VLPVIALLIGLLLYLLFRWRTLENRTKGR